MEKITTITEAKKHGQHLIFIYHKLYHKNNFINDVEPCMTRAKETQT